MFSLTKKLDHQHCSFGRGCVTCYDEVSTGRFSYCEPVVILDTAGPGAQNICGAHVWEAYLTKSFFNFLFVKILMPQSCAT